MTDEEFNRRVNRLIDGLPVTLVITRLCLALKAAVDAGGDASANARRHMVEDASNDGEDWYEYQQGIADGIPW